MHDKITVAAVLAMVYTLGFLATIAALMFGVVPPANEKYILLLLGSLVSFAGAAVQFFFGSSLGSAKKDETIADLTAPKDGSQATK
jgi:hypothetical protein